MALPRGKAGLSGVRLFPFLTGKQERTFTLQDFQVLAVNFVGFFFLFFLPLSNIQPRHCVTLPRGCFKIEKYSPYIHPPC